jgi:transcriptional regulator with XRE-family HTH domain
MDNKNIFASNLKKYMEVKGKSRNDISEALGISYFTVSDWVNGKKYPRMDKVEMLANYFGVQKSDLIEKKVKSSTPEEPVLSEGEKLLLDLFRRVPNEQQQLVLQMIRAALGSQE